MNKTLLTATLVALPLVAGAQETTEEVTEVQAIDLTTWDRSMLYEGWRAENLLDTEVVGLAGEELGEVEDLLINPDGSLDGIIIEGGGFWDIGDTHFRVSWDQVEVDPAMEYVTVPITEETVEEFGAFVDWDDRETVRRYRASELIGDYVSLEDTAAYGIVDDLIFDQDGQLQAVVVTPDISYGVTGPYAYPYYGYGYGAGYGYQPGVDVYRMPYTRADIAELEPFEDDEIEVEIED
ncbi:MAG: PRC-barrel domain-containing protein [Candidatus Competibacteraceae bacterium]|nr:PRC-barrel domain-containing protein [Candidatus Competibacteraceae bacterium]